MEKKQTILNATLRFEVYDFELWERRLSFKSYEKKVLKSGLQHWRWSKKKNVWKLQGFVRGIVGIL